MTAHDADGNGMLRALPTTTHGLQACGCAARARELRASKGGGGGTKRSGQQKRRGREQKYFFYLQK